MFSLDDFDYKYPATLIAQQPLASRDSCRLLVINRDTKETTHRIFSELPDLLDENTVIVRNNTKVLPARLFGQKDTGGKCEVLLIRQLPSPTPRKTTRWECLTKPGLKHEQVVSFPFGKESSPVLQAHCLGSADAHGYTKLLEFSCAEQDFYRIVFELGNTPLPPYIDKPPQDEAHVRELYQTTFAQSLGSVAAPTAGLHFTPDLDERLHAKGIKILEVTLHVGLGTFMPVQDEQLASKQLHQEVFELTEDTATQLRQAKDAGKKIIAVGTTTTRVLESCVKDGVLTAQSGSTQLFIQPGDAFQVVDGLITNFHVPQSSLLMLVSAFTSAPNSPHPFKNFADTPVGLGYQEAILKQYRLFSFGDAMLLW